MSESGKLRGKTALITGGTGGFGFAVAKAMHSEGASIILLARDEGMLDERQWELEKTHCPAPACIYSYSADVASESQMGYVVRQVLDLPMVMASETKVIDILVCAAGVYGPIGPVEGGGSDGWEQWKTTVETNLYGTVIPCRMVLPYMIAARSGRILLLSGGGATCPQPNFTAYAATKAAVVQFGESLAKEVKPFGITVNSIAPGALNTPMLQQVLDAGPRMVGQAFYERAVRQKETGGDDPSLGARLCVELCTPAAKDITGRLISAKWDHWDPIDRFSAGIQGTEECTLRRVAPMIFLEGIK